MERRKEYEKDEIIACPKCGSEAVYYDQAPEIVKCESCGLEFEIRQVAVWQDATPEPSIKRREVEQAEIEVEGRKFTVTHIPTATSEMWYTIHDAFEMWGAINIDLNGEVQFWRNPPKEEHRVKFEDAVKKAFAAHFEPEI